MKYDEVLISLPTLTKTQLKAIRAAADQLIGNETIINDPTKDLFHALILVLGMQGLTFENFHKTATFKTWRKNAYPCIEFIDTTWPEAIKSKVTRQALMMFLMGILRDTIKGWGVPVTLNAMVNIMPSLENTFDHAFPGYRESGMAHLILKNMQRGNSSGTRKPKSKG